MWQKSMNLEFMRRLSQNTQYSSRLFFRTLTSTLGNQLQLKKEKTKLGKLLQWNLLIRLVLLTTKVKLLLRERWILETRGLVINILIVRMMKNLRKKIISHLDLGNLTLNNKEMKISFRKRMIRKRNRWFSENRMKRLEFLSNLRIVLSRKRKVILWFLRCMKNQSSRKFWTLKKLRKKSWRELHLVTLMTKMKRIMKF